MPAASPPRTGLSSTAFPSPACRGPCSTPPASVRARQLDGSLGRSEEPGLFDLAAVRALLARTAGHPGHGELRRALAVYREPSFTRSGIERRFLDLLRDSGLPRPSTGFNVGGHELDFFWTAEHLAVEVAHLRDPRHPCGVRARPAP